MGRGHEDRKKGEEEDLKGRRVSTLATGRLTSHWGCGGRVETSTR